jgi:hypothetical protein
MERLVLKSKSRSKLDLIQKVAVEMGVKIERSTKAKKLVDEVTLVSEASLAEAWNSKEDDRWDKLYKRK